MLTHWYASWVLIKCNRPTFMLSRCTLFTIVTVCDKMLRDQDVCSKSVKQLLSCVATWSVMWRWELTAGSRLQPLKLWVRCQWQTDQSRSGWLGGWVKWSNQENMMMKVILAQSLSGGPWPLPLTCPGVMVPCTLDLHGCCQQQSPEPEEALPHPLREWCSHLQIRWWVL